MHVPSESDQKKEKEPSPTLDEKAAPLPSAFLEGEEGQTPDIEAPVEPEDGEEEAVEPEPEATPAGTSRSSRIAAIAAAAKAKQDAKKRILVVDDEPDTLETVRDMLELHGYEVICATDGEEAVEQAQTGKPDLIVLDVMLPKMNGFEVCKLIKDPLNPKNRNCWQAPVVMLTAKAKGRDVQYAKSVGADGFVRKPFKPVDLHKRIEKLLRKR